MPDKLAHHARVGHDRSVHQMLRNEGRLRRCRKRDIVLHRTPLAVAREKLDDGAHTVAAVAMALDGTWLELRADALAHGALVHNIPNVCPKSVISILYALCGDVEQTAPCNVKFEKTKCVAAFGIAVQRAAASLS